MRLFSYTKRRHRSVHSFRPTPAQNFTTRPVGPGPRLVVSPSAVRDTRQHYWQTDAVAGSMISTRDHHTATLLTSGQVLIAGGDGGGGAGAELYDATTGWSTTASMTSARYGGHTATLLLSGQVVVAGGSVVTGNAASAEVYTSGTSTPPAPADTVTVKLAQYDTAKHVLSVEATSTSASATLTVAVTSTGQTIGTLTNSGGGTYKAQFNWPNNPMSVTIKSSLGGASTATVTAK